MPDAVEIGKVAVRVYPKTEGFRDEVDDVLDRLERSMRLDIKLGVDATSKKAVQAELAVLTRRRDAEIKPEINDAAAAKVAATLAALSGGRSLKELGSDFADWVGNLDRAVPKIAAASVVLGNLSSAALVSTSNLLSLGGSLATVAQAGIALPGILGGIAIGTIAAGVVLKDFNEHLPAFAIGLGRSSKAGKKWADLQDDMSEGFWVRAEKPIRSFITEIFPELSEGLVDTSKDLGTFFAALAGSGEGQFNQSLAGMFDGLSDSIRVASKHTDSFVGIIDKLGSVGADNLPKLAGWFGDIADQFDEWLGRSDLQGFVDTGVDSLKDLGAIARDLGSSLATLAEIADESGASTLDTLRRTSASIRKTVESPSFQKPLRNMFEGAREGLDNLTDEAGPEFKSFIARFANTLGKTLPILGDTAGEALEGIFTALDRPEIQHTVVAFFKAVDDAVGELTPALPGVADGLAGIVDVLSSLTRGVGTALGDALAILGPEVADLAPHLIPLTEELAELIDLLVKGSGPVISELADSLASLSDSVTDILDPLNDLLSLFGQLPDSASGALAGLVALGLTVGATTWVGAGVRSKLTSFNKSIEKAGKSGFFAQQNMSVLSSTVQGIAAKITPAKAAIAGLAIAAGTQADQVGLSNTVMLGLAGTMGGPLVAAGLAAVGMALDIKNQYKQTGETIDSVAKQIAQAVKTGDPSGVASGIDTLSTSLSKARKEEEKWGVAAFLSGQTWADDWARLTDGTTTVEKYTAALEQAVSAARQVTTSGISAAFDAGSFDKLKTALDGATAAMDAAKAAGEDDAFVELKANADRAYDAVVTFRDAMAEVGLAIGEVQKKSVMVDGELPSLLEIDDADVNRISSSVLPALDRLNISVESFVATASEGGRAGQRMVNQVVAAMDFLNSRAGMTETAVNAINDLDKRMGSASDKANTLRASLDALFAPTAGLIQATDQWHAGLEGLNSQLKDTDQSLFAQTQVGRANREVIIGLAGQLNDLIVAQAGAGKSAKSIKNNFVQQRQALIDAASAAFGHRKEVRELINQLLLVPKDVVAKVKTDGFKKAKDEAKSLDKTLRNVGKGKAPTTEINQWGGAVRHLIGQTATEADGKVKKIEQALDFKAPKPQMGPWVSGIQDGVNKGKTAANASITVGTALKQGIINGFAGTQGILVAQAVAAVNAAITAAKAAAAIHSPSRKMYEVGDFMGKGLVLGLLAQKKHAQKAADEVTKATIKRYEKVAKGIDHLLSVINEKASKEQKKAHAEQIKHLKKLSAEYDKTLSKLKDLLQRQRDFENGVRDTIIETGNPVGFDITTPEGVITGLQDAVKNAEAFRDIIRKLRREGLNKTILKQILAAGPEAGLSVAQSILNAGVDQINDLQQQLQHAAGQTANTAGDYLFGNLIDEAQGNVDALLKRLKPLQHALREFARKLVHALRDEMDKQMTGKGGNHEKNARLLAGNKLRQARTASLDVPSGANGASKPTTFNYYAAPGSKQLTAEEQLFGAVRRSRMVLAKA